MYGKQLNQYQLTNFARVDLKPEQFDQLVYQKGARVVWEKAILCSCISRETGQPDFTCPACKGKGFQYFDPKEIRAAVTSIGREDEAMPAGLLDVGTAFLTTRAQDNVNFRDRITFQDFRTVYSEVLTYEGDEVEMTYDIEKLLHLKVLSKEIDPSQYTLSEDRKKIIFEDGVLQYGERFSILVEVKPTYIVIDMPHELRGTFVKFGYPDEEWIVLPKQLLIKREDLMPLKRGEIR